MIDSEAAVDFFAAKVSNYSSLARTALSENRTGTDF